jgi:signal transduction histidine kinase
MCFALFRLAPALGLAVLLAGPAHAGEEARQSANPEPPPVSASALQYGVGSWIWTETTYDGQECRFWKSFEIPTTTAVEDARLRITADNFYQVFLDGRDIGRGADWQCLTEYDLTLLLKPGIHVLAVIGINDFDAAGVLAGLHIRLTEGRTMEIGSDQSWLVVPNGERSWTKQLHPSGDWHPARVVAAFGTGPWRRTGLHPRVFKAPPLQAVVLPFWRAGWFQITLACLCAVGMVVCLFLMGRLMVQSQAQQVVRRERARIARDIHDDLGAGLTQLVLMGETLQSEAPPGSETRVQLGQVCEKTRGLFSAINETVWAINSQRDTLRDLASYLCKYAEAFFQPTPIRCRFDIEPEMPAIPCDVGVRRNLFLAVKEALNNVLRHSQATEAFLRIQRRGREVIVTVEDNGKGFDPASANAERNGLRNMTERAAEAGGDCAVVTRPGAGCVVRFTAPLVSPYGYRPQWLVRKRRRAPLAPAPAPAPPPTAATLSDRPLKSGAL